MDTDEPQTYLSQYKIISQHDHGSLIPYTVSWLQIWLKWPLGISITLPFSLSVWLQWVVLQDCGQTSKLHSTHPHLLQSPAQGSPSSPQGAPAKEELCEREHETLNQNWCKLDYLMQPCSHVLYYFIHFEMTFIHTLCMTTICTCTTHTMDHDQHRYILITIEADCRQLHIQLILFACG